MLTFTFIHNDKETFTAKCSSFDELRALKAGSKDAALEDVIFPIRAGNKPSNKRLLAYAAKTDFIRTMEMVDHTRATMHIGSQKVPQGIAMSCRQCFSTP
jgi:hypothetical protein